MSCYLRHLKGVLARAGVEPADKKERKVVDSAVREITGAGNGPCNEAWKIVREWVKDPAREQVLVSELQTRLKQGRKN